MSYAKHHLNGVHISFYGDTYFKVWMLLYKIAHLGTLYYQVLYVDIRQYSVILFLALGMAILPHQCILWLLPLTFFSLPHIFVLVAKEKRLGSMTGYNIRVAEMAGMALSRLLPSTNPLTQS
jgi:hypothetical protein